jgi:hypothetical protein
VNAAPTSGSPGTSISITGTTAQIPVTTQGIDTIYFYLEDAAGRKNPNTAVSVIAKFDNVPPRIFHDSTSVGIVTISSTGSVSGSAIINASASDSGSGIKSFLIQYKRFSDGYWSPLGTSPDTSVTIPNTFFLENDRKTPSGVEYQLVATDLANNVTVRSYTILPTIQQLPIIINTDGAVGTQLLNYRMFSVPFPLSDKSPKTVLFNGGVGNPSDGKGHEHYNWRLQSLNANGSFDDYETIADSPSFNLGAALMLIVREHGKNVTVTPTGIADARQMSEQGIPLQAGWNLVGDPFPFAIPTDSLFMSNSVQNTMQFAYYSGTGTTNGWVVSTGPTPAMSLKPWEGLAIKPSVAGNLVFKNALSSSSAAPSADLTVAPNVSDIIKASKGQSWAMQIDATRNDGGLNDRGLLIGMVDQVNQPTSSLNWSHPPFFGDKVVSVYFDGGTDRLMRDFRQLSDSGNTWEMKVRTGDRAAKVKLSIEGANTITNSQWKTFLIDLDEHMAYDLQDRSTIDINSGNGLRNFRIVVGTKSFIELNSAGVDLYPTSFKLYPNYPNPFNPETVIRYAVPDDQPAYNVSVKVYDILGREVTTVVEGNQKSGYYEVRFGTKNLSSGVYLCRMSVTDGNRHSAYQNVIKMMMLK